MEDKIITLDTFRLFGLALPFKTTNKYGKSNIDCGNLWQQFEKDDYYSRIPGKLGDEVIAVYHEYKGDYTQPFSYFIVCKIAEGTDIPEDMSTLTVPSDSYQKVIAKGEMPECITNAWKQIWKSDLARAYRADFEIYDERSQNWNNAEVDIFVSVE